MAPPGFYNFEGTFRNAKKKANPHSSSQSQPQSKTIGWIWPKDPRPGNPSSWPRRWRLFDILTNKGPDIYIGVIGDKRTTSSRSESPYSQTRLSSSSSSPCRSSSSSFYSSDSQLPSSRTGSLQKTNWDLWDKDHSRSSRGTPSSEDGKLSTKPQVPWAKRGNDERYDFRRRKYTVPDLGTWSRVQYCSSKGKGGWIRFGRREKHCVPRQYWDQNGKEYPANYWHDIIHGEHEDEQ